MASIEVLEGKIITDIINNNNEELIFTTEDGSVYRMYHPQQCCESVLLEDVIGDLSDLLLTPIISAYASSNYPEDLDTSGTWTFYNINTNKGSVSLRWLGISNDYYSEEVFFDCMIDSRDLDE